MTIDESLILKAKTDSSALEELVRQYEIFILRSASDTTGRYVSKQDDEWSIALEGFVHAVSKYQPESGDFFVFSRLVIKRRLIDYIRHQQRYRQELSVNPDLFNDEAEEEDLKLKTELNQKTAVQEQRELKEEIEAANQCFSQYGFNFFDLTNCSPKAEKTKSACKKAIVFLLNSPVLFYDMQHSKCLPIKIIHKNTDVPQKILERHRKYIIAAAEILSGEYPCLAYYMRTIRKELER